MSVGDSLSIPRPARAFMRARAARMSATSSGTSCTTSALLLTVLMVARLSSQEATSERHSL
eukprot:6147974-Pyramimonas_sp.AAC.1